MKLNLLIVEDELIVAANIKSVLLTAGHTICGVARSVRSALDILQNHRPDMVLIDIYLKGEMSGIDLAFQLNEKNIPFVYISANSSREVLEDAKATGPYGFIVKPFREKDLLISLDIAWYRHEFHLQNKPIPYKNSTSPTLGEAAENGIIGRAPLLNTAIMQAKQVANTDTSVLLLGESGTGKEQLARYIHYLSGRRLKPFITVNCAALPPHLFESELFGHEKGSFTDAFEKKIGKFEQADEGTIFLDEIGELPGSLQVKLLRVLQEKEIQRIGGNQLISINVRIIAATNRVLEKEIADGRFRPDLYYRLYVFPITMPPLRERSEDIPLLTEHFIRAYATKIGKVVTEISTTALVDMMQYQWPGNIRELQNLVERAVLMSTDTCIHKIPLPEKTDIPQTVAAPLPKTMEEMERDHIMEVLKYCNYKLSGPGGAAEILNVSPAVLSTRIKKLGIIKTHFY